MGVYPYAMYQAIRAIGTDWVTLSSDCGEPLFPNSVEGMRMIIACMFLDGVILQATMNVMVGQSAAADKSIVPYVHKPRIRLARRLARESRRGQEKNNGHT